jgi:hypothetical protein
MEFFGEDDVLTPPSPVNTLQNGGMDNCGGKVFSRGVKKTFSNKSTEELKSTHAIIRQRLFLVVFQRYGTDGNTKRFRGLRLLGESWNL